MSLYHINDKKELRLDAIESFTEVVVAPLVNVKIKLKSSASDFHSHNNIIDKKISKTNEKKSIKKKQFSLQQYLTPKGQPYTHRSLIGGCYNIPDQSLKLLHQYISKCKSPIHLTEKHPEKASSICIDFDFRLDKQPNQRMFDFDFLLKVVKLYNHHLLQMGISDQNLYTSRVLYRNSGYMDPKSGQFKDEFHIQYPHLIIDYDSQYELRNRIVNDFRISDWMPKTLNNIEDVVDRSVIQKNNWILYGCSKPQLPAYQVKHILKMCKDELIESQVKYTALDWINILSLRLMENKHISLTNYIKPSPKNVNKNTSSEMCSSNKGSNIARDAILKKVKTKTDNYEFLEELLSYLGNHRCEEHFYWIQVGWALFNICEDKEKALGIYIKWSQLLTKYQDGCCQEVFNRAKSTGSLIGIGSLIMWVTADQKPGFEILLEKSKKNYPLDWLIQKSMSGCSEHIADLLYHLYKNEYVCSSIKHNKWFEFVGHKWVEIDNAYTLFGNLGQKLDQYYVPYSKQFQESIDNISKKLENNKKEIQDFQKQLRNAKKRVRSDQNDQLVEELQENIYNKKTVTSGLKTEFQTLTNQLKNVQSVRHIVSDMHGKNKQMKECCLKFYQPKFNQLLDSNPDLFGFENGIYDLKQGQLRSGKPEDYVSFSAGYNYQEYDEEDPLIVEVMCFLYQIFPDQELREFMFLIMSSYLSGHNDREKFYIWIGGGGNGKSKLLELLESVLGEYAAKIPVSLLTQKKGASNSAKPEVSKLRGVRLVSTQETEKDDKVQIGTMKDMTNFLEKS